MLFLTTAPSVLASLPLLRFSRLTLGGRLGLAGALPRAQMLGRGFFFGVEAGSSSALPIVWGVGPLLITLGFLLAGGTGGVELLEVRGGLAPSRPPESSDWPVLVNMACAVRKLGGLEAEPLTGLGAKSGAAPPPSSLCCRSLATELIGFWWGVSLGWMGLGGAAPPLSSFTQGGFVTPPARGLGVGAGGGLGMQAGWGLGKTGLVSVKLREGFWRGGLDRVLLGSSTSCENDESGGLGLKGFCLTGGLPSS